MAEDSRSNIIQNRMWCVLAKRSKYTGIPNILLSLTSYMIFQRMHFQSLASLIPYVMVVSASLVRMFLLISLAEDKKPNKTIQFIYFSSVLVLSLGWGLLFIFVLHFYSLKSIQAAYGFVIMAGLCSGALSTFSTSRLSYAFFSLPMLMVSASYLLYHDGTEALTPVGLMCFFIIFQLTQSNLTHFYIHKSIQTEHELTWERDKVQSLINAVPGFVTFIDNELIYRSINNFGQNFLGEDIVGKKLGYKGSNSLYYKFVSDFLKSDKDTDTQEIEIEGHGKVSTFIVSIKKIFEPVGGAVIVSLPMDELIKARKELKEQEAKVYYSAKLVSLGEMAAGIAHEINNPLAIIQASSDQILRQLKNPEISIEMIKSCSERIQNTINRISVIIKNLKALSRNGDRDPFMPVNLQQIIYPSVEVSRQKFLHEDINLHIEQFNDKIEITGQEVPLSQVTMNLLANAFDAAQAGNHPKWVKITINENKHHIDVLFQDSGEGIPPEIRNKIMEPFFTTKPVNKGTGLGLSICKNIIENHGGTLLLDEDRPHTTFIMRLKR